MKISEFFKVLDTSSEDKQVVFKTPDGKFIPFHYHVTEPAIINKKFRDCGGVERNENYASIQLWVASDYDHRINTGKLRKIVLSTITEIEKDYDLIVEYETDSLASYNIEKLEFVGGNFVFSLGKRKADCLAPDKCGIQPEVKKPCCQGKCS